MNGKNLTKDMHALARNTANFIQRDLPKIVEVEGLKHIKESFRNEGFTNRGLDKWKERKTKDDSGRDTTRYRTDRVGRKGSLNRYGRKIQGRPILTGYATGGNKLRNSWRAKTNRHRVVFYTYKPYAKRHNEGTDGMPKRQFVGPSKKMDDKIERKVNQSMNRLFQ